MAIIVGEINCADKYQQVAVMGSSVGDPIPAGIGCLTENDFDTIDAGSVSLFYEPALAASSPNDAPSDYYQGVIQSGTNELINIPMNNFFDDARKIYSAAANSLPYDKAATELTKLANKAARQNAMAELACLALEGTVVHGEASTKDTIKQHILDDQSAIRDTGANPTIAVCTPTFYAKLVISAGESLKEMESNERWLNATVGTFLGVVWVSSPLLAGSNAKYYNNQGSLEGAAFENIEYIMWDGSKFAAVNRINEFDIKDGGALFSGSAACMSSMLGVKLLESTACIARYGDGAAAGEEEVVDPMG